jgi:hypothetical protein
VNEGISDDGKAHDMTLTSGASFNGGIFLAAAVVDRGLKGCMAGESMNVTPWFLKRIEFYKVIYINK